MKTDIFTAGAVVRMLREQTVASIAEITDALGAPSHRIVCRKLVQADCRSSYSHCGRY